MILLKLKKVSELFLDNQKKRKSESANNIRNFTALSSKASTFSLLGRTWVEQNI